MEEKEFEHLPDKVGYALSNIEKVFGINFNEVEVVLKNRGGLAYAKGWGVSYSYCTSSLLDGPSYDYSDEFKTMLRALGFELANSYGDNGLDSSTNWQDTYWTYEWIFKDTEMTLSDEDEIDRLSTPIFTDCYDEYEF